MKFIFLSAVLAQFSCCFSSWAELNVTYLVEEPHLIAWVDNKLQNPMVVEALHELPVEELSSVVVYKGRTHYENQTLYINPAASVQHIIETAQRLRLPAPRIRQRQLTIPLANEELAEDYNGHGDVNEFIELLAIIGTAPIGLPIETLDALDDLLVYPAAGVVYTGAKVTELLWNSVTNLGRGVALLGESIADIFWYIIHPDHPEPNLEHYFDGQSILSFEYNDIAGEGADYWDWAYDHSGNYINTWMTEHAFALFGSKPPEEKGMNWGFIHGLECSKKSEANGAFIIGIRHAECKDTDGNWFEAYGGSATLGMFGDEHRSYMAIFSLNPFGDVEGHYTIGAAGPGLFVAGLVKVGVSEFGGKILLGVEGRLGLGAAQVEQLYLIRRNIREGDHIELERNLHHEDSNAIFNDTVWKVLEIQEDHLVMELVKGVKEDDSWVSRATGEKFYEGDAGRFDKMAIGLVSARYPHKWKRKTNIILPNN